MWKTRFDHYCEGGQPSRLADSSVKSTSHLIYTDKSKQIQSLHPIKSSVVPYITMLNTVISHVASPTAH